MSCVYIISSPLDESVYVGSSRFPNRRWQKHKIYARHGSSSLAEAMRENGVESYSFSIVSEHGVRADAYEAEAAEILRLRSEGRSLHNISAPDRSGWFSVLTDDERAKFDNLSVKQENCLRLVDEARAKINRLADTARARMRKQMKEEARG